MTLINSCVTWTELCQILNIWEVFVCLFGFVGSQVEPFYCFIGLLDVCSLVIFMSLHLVNLKTIKMCVKFSSLTLKYVTRIKLQSFISKLSLNLDVFFSSLVLNSSLNSLMRLSSVVFMLIYLQYVCFCLFCCFLFFSALFSQ